VRIFLALIGIVGIDWNFVVMLLTLTHTALFVWRLVALFVCLWGTSRLRLTRCLCPCMYCGTALLLGLSRLLPLDRRIRLGSPKTREFLVYSAVYVAIAAFRCGCVDGM